MRITAMEVQDGVIKESEIENVLQRFVAVSNRIESAYWTKMLVLMKYLASHGPDIELHGNFILQQIHLSQRSLPTDDPELNEKLNQHMKRWKAENPEAQGSDARSRDSFLREIRKFHPAPNASATVRVDWQDYAPLQDGVPEMHYRIEIKKRSVNQKVVETRTQDLAECERIFREAFLGESRGNR